MNRATNDSLIRKIHLTPRDSDLLTLLVRGPYTIDQILRCSTRFCSAFESYESLRRRLAKLAKANLIRSWQYYVPAAGRTRYYKLTPSTYRLLMPGYPLPSRSWFNEIKFGSQNHTFHVQELLSRIDSAAAQHGHTLQNLRPDGQAVIRVGDDELWPDAEFEIEGRGECFKFYLELDCGTEPIQTTKQRESLARKIQIYDRYHFGADVQSKVLNVFVSSPLRMTNFLDTARQLIHNPRGRSFLWATTFDQLVCTEDLIFDKIFQTQNRDARSLLINRPIANEKESEMFVPCFQPC